MIERTELSWARLRTGLPHRRRPYYRQQLLAGAILALASAASLCAYDHPLTDTDVRNAYFLGTDKQRAAEFLADYTQGADYTEAPGAAKPGPQVAEIEVLTPYALAVDSSRQRTIGYSAQDAEQEYNKNPDRLVVRIQIVSGTNNGLFFGGGPSSGRLRRRAAHYIGERMLQGLQVFVRAGKRRPGKRR